MLYEIHIYCLEEDAFDVRRAIPEIMSHSVMKEGYAHLKINSPTWKIFNFTKKIPVGIPFIAIYIDHTDLRSREVPVKIHTFTPDPQDLSVTLNAYEPTIYREIDELLNRYVNPKTREHGYVQKLLEIVDV